MTILYDNFNLYASQKYSYNVIYLQYFRLFFNKLEVATIKSKVAVDELNTIQTPTSNIDS